MPDEKGLSPRQRQRRRLKAAGICVKCTKVPVAKGRAMCAPCLQDHAASQRRFRRTPDGRKAQYAAHNAWKARRRAAGICVRCGERPPWKPGAAECRSCRERENERKRALYWHKKGLEPLPAARPYERSPKPPEPPEPAVTGPLCVMCYKRPATRSWSDMCTECIAEQAARRRKE